MSDTTKPNGAKLLNLQARKIITKHKNLFVFRELHLNLQREGLAGWRDHPSILFLHSSIYGAPTIMCQVVYGNSREQNRQKSLSSGANNLLCPCSFLWTHPPSSMPRIHEATGQNWADLPITPWTWAEDKFSPGANPDWEQRPHTWSAISLDITTIITLALDKAESQLRTEF